MSVIIRVDGWEALDSRGRPTVAARIELADGSEGIALVPSGASTGAHEARELRDGGERYDGRGVLQAVNNVRSVLAGAVRGIEATEVDSALAQVDPSVGYADVGANALLSVSLAALRAEAASSGRSLARHLTGDDSRALLLPMPMVNILSGGAHAGALLDVQDFLAIPVGAATFAESIEWCGRVRDAARALALTRGHAQAVLVADEGGLGLGLKSNREALEILDDAIRAAGLVPGTQVAIGIDVAASQFYSDGKYRLACEGRELSADELIGEITDWSEQYPIVSIEDILAEDDWSGWAKATEQLGHRIELVGDDLFVTSPERLVRGVREHVANSVLVKVNQNGLVSGARAVVDIARAAGYSTVVSARSGETEDAWLVDLAVGWRVGQIKVGSTHRAERTAKWNRLLQLEALEDTTFAGPWPDRRPRKDLA